MTEPIPNQFADHSTTSAPVQPPLSPQKALLGVVVLLLFAVILAVAGILPRIHSSAALASETQANAIPTVFVSKPEPGAPITEVVLPGNVSAYTDAPISARTSGYLTRWYFDIGAHVKKGALLAEISTPELDRQVSQAEADLATARANANNARLNAKRYQQLVTSNAVSQQDTDTFTNQSAALTATVQSAEENLARLKNLQSFEKLYAPFDGVITARNIDVGQLVDSGANKEIFHMQAVSTLRVYINVPQVWASYIKPGSTATLTLSEDPNHSFSGKLVRTADSIDPTSRTLLVEVDVDNRKGELLSGSLVQAHFKIPAQSNSVIVPPSALIFRQSGLQLAVVRNNHAHLATVTIGQDDGRRVQISSGITANDLIIQNPPDSLVDGEEVRIVNPAGSK
jgi:RND family efflux transporter MFP subunit